MPMHYGTIGTNAPWAMQHSTASLACPKRAWPLVYIYIYVCMSIYLSILDVYMFLRFCLHFYHFFGGFIYEFICSYQNGGFSDFVPIRKPSYQPVLWFLHRRSEAFYTGNPLPGGVLDASGGAVFFGNFSKNMRIFCGFLQNCRRFQFFSH